MCTQHPMIDLGFTEGRVPAGTHICQIYSDEDERNDSLLKFIICGLKAREKTACFSDGVTPDFMKAHLAAAGLSISKATAAGDFVLAGGEDIYFADGRFDPDRMLKLLEQFDEAARAEGHPASRVIGEMSSRIDHIEGGSRLMEYESRVSLLLRQHPVTAVCQYNANHFDGATIMGVLKVHPMMVIRGTVVKNPFYVPPEEFLQRKG